MIPKPLTRYGALNNPKGQTELRALNRPLPVHTYRYSNIIQNIYHSPLYCVLAPIIISLMKPRRTVSEDCSIVYRQVCEALGHIEWRLHLAGDFCEAEPNANGLSIIHLCEFDGHRAHLPRTGKLTTKILDAAALPQNYYGLIAGKLCSHYAPPEVIKAVYLFPALNLLGSVRIG